MKRSIQIAGAFVGLIVGAGFASGQEILQYFTSFGYWGIAGSILATALFAFFGMTLAQLGSQLQTTSHKGVIYHIGGRYIGIVLDLLITFFLFGVAVVMFAGAGSTFEQMFGIDARIGSIVLVVLTILTLLLNLKNIMNLIAAITPYLLVVILVILGYSLFTMDVTFGEAHNLAMDQPSAATNWLLGALLYVSYNIACGAALLIVMGGAEKDQKVAGTGGILGGILLGVMILLVNITLYVKIDVIAGVDMPTLELANQIHPVVGILMAIALLGMMYNTAVGMFYSFTVRFVAADHRYFKFIIILVGLAGYVASLVGFTTLVGKVYSTVGYLGFALMIAILIAWYRGRKQPA
ncbi:hypothetical protein ACFO0S_09235 [Chryseomicrobium palamuruense]|uniref:Membrane protein YkvI n=1 Tax=Chryseomicrobium palamuruense TaxID=682973 RepID=A0ABV8UXQ7_9BACL